MIEPRNQSSAATEERKTFTVPPGYEAVRDGEGRATGEVRQIPTDAQSVRMAAIEECAKICDDLRHDDYSAETSEWSGGTFDCARAIRALTSQPSPAATVETRRTPLDLSTTELNQLATDAFKAAALSHSSAVSDPLKGLDERLDRLFLTADDGNRFVLSTESAKNIVGIVREWIRTRAEPQTVGCGTPGCADPNCECGKEPPTRDDIAEAIFKTLRPDNPNHVNELFPSAADIYFAAADAVLALSRPHLARGE